MVYLREKAETIVKTMLIEVQQLRAILKIQLLKNLHR